MLYAAPVAAFTGYGFGQGLLALQTDMNLCLS